MAQAEQLRRALKRQPFRPFRLRMVDGTIYTVPHPDWLSVPPAEIRPREVAYYQKPESVPTDVGVHSGVEGVPTMESARTRAFTNG